MQNFQFDLTNATILSSFNPEEFQLYCSKNGKQSNLQIIINEKLETVIQTATKIKRNKMDLLEQKKVFHETKNDKFCPTWAFYEYKFFTYMTYLYGYIRRVDLVNLTSQDVKVIKQYFSDKPQSFVLFELKNLQKMKREKWTQIEDERLVSTIKRVTPKGQKIGWKVIAYQIFVTSEMKLFRTYKECRQRWSNHLNPLVKRSYWTIQQDQKLFEMINKEGKKWSKIVEKMNSTRTQHMIKNRCNSYLRKWSKVFPNRKEEYYFQGIINYLTGIDQKDQFNLLNKINGKQGRFQQKKVKSLRSSVSKKQTKKQVESYQQSQELKQQQSFEIKMEVENQNIELIKQNTYEQIECKHQESQIAHYKYFGKLNNSQNQVVQKVQSIPQYEITFLPREAVNMIESLPENVQNYLQRDPNFIKMVDDTWLSDLQEKQNMKWLQWLSE